METMEKQALSASAYQQKKLRQALRMKRLINYIPIAGTVVLAAMFFLLCLTRGYAVGTNLQVVIKRAMIVGFLATGATFIFAIGSFDLSLGANMLVSAALGAAVYTWTGSLLLMLAVCIAVCVALSLLNAALASVFNLPVFVMTIAMMSVFSALSSLIISNVDAGGIDTRLSRASNPDNVYYQVIGNIWFQLLILVIFVLLCAFLFNYMKMGRRQKFIGGNPVCARLTGIAPAVAILLRGLEGDKLVDADGNAAAVAMSHLIAHSPEELNEIMTEDTDGNYAFNAGVVSALMAADHDRFMARPRTPIGRRSKA